VRRRIVGEQALTEGQERGAPPIGQETPEEQASFVQLKHVIKDDGHGIISAKLALYYSVVDDGTLPEMIRTAHDSAAMEAALRKTSYWSADGWQNYEAARTALEAALIIRLSIGSGSRRIGRQMQSRRSRSASRSSLPIFRSTISYPQSRAILAFRFRPRRSLFICWPIPSHTGFALLDCVSSRMCRAIYTDYKQASSQNRESYSQWFVRAVQDGQLRGRKLQKTVQSFFSSTHCH